MVDPGPNLDPIKYLYLGPAHLSWTQLDPNLTPNPSQYRMGLNWTQLKQRVHECVDTQVHEPTVTSIEVCIKYQHFTTAQFKHRYANAF